jgi:hypothetical protein
VDRNARRLVDGEQVRILEDDGELPRRRGRVVGPGGDAQRRQAHRVAELEPHFGIDAGGVDADFARTDHAVEVRLRHALGDLGQEVVEPLPVRGRVDGQMTHLWPRAGAGGRTGGVRLYNPPAHAVAVRCLER